MESSRFSVPLADEYGFVKTLNNQGFMINHLDPFSEEFVRFASIAPGPVLDIGAAFGVASIAALERGAVVIANDIESAHLDILKSEAVRLVADLKDDQLRTIACRFPAELDLAPESLGAVLACRVFHFFDGATIEEGTHRIHQWLRPGGKFFLVSETPYVGGLSSFRPVYDSRKAAGDPWPGYIDDFMKIDPDRGPDLPRTMHLLDPEVLARVFRNSGFEVERVELIPRPEFPPSLRLDGRESVGIVGIKL